MNVVDDGDNLFMQLNMSTVENIVKGNPTSEIEEDIEIEIKE